MKRLLLIVLTVLGGGISQAQVVVNPDGSHSVVHGSVIVNPDGTHSTIHGNVIVNSDGTYSTIHGPVVVNPNGTHSILVGSATSNADSQISQVDKEQPLFPFRSKPENQNSGQSQKEKFSHRQRPERTTGINCLNGRKCAEKREPSEEREPAEKRKLNESKDILPVNDPRSGEL